MKTNRFLFVIGAIVITTALDLPTASPQQELPRNLFQPKYQGVTVEDPYQWLEKDDEPEVKAWSDAQNQRTSAISRQVAGPGGDRETIDRVVRENFAELFRRLSRGRGCCSR